MGETTPEGLDEEAVRRRAYEISLGESAGSADENWRLAERELLAESGVLYDTGDLRLQQLELELTRAARNGSAVWRLRLARGELIEAAAEPEDPDRLPPEISGLVSHVVGEEPLAPAPVLRLDAGVLRLRELLRAQLHALLQHEPGVRVGSDPENLHRHRVAARRSRAFLRATRDFTDPAWREALEALLTDLGGFTGPVRDLDVLLEHLEAELPALGEADQAGGERLVRHLEADRRHARELLLAALDCDQYRLLLDRLGEPPRLGPGIDSLPLDQIAAQELRRLLKAVRRLGDEPSDAELHELRIRVKRARYAAELAGPGERTRDRFLEQAKRLQVVLGDHQDAAVAEDRLRQLAARETDATAAFVAGRLAERQHVRREQATGRLPSAWRRLRKLDGSASG